MDEENLQDVDIEMLRESIKILANEGELPMLASHTELLAFELSESFWHNSFQAIASKLNSSDRFICGIATAVENHLVTWRKDTNNYWWEIDSLSPSQIDRHSSQMAEVISSNYGQYTQGQIFFITP